MGLEAVMICVDNSEWSRNGDYTPSRFDGQNEAANLLAGHKTGQNPETGVGLMTMAGERAEIHLTPSTDFMTGPADLGAFIAALSEMRITGGKADLVRAIQSATLALKHRQNKNQKQKIIAFVGSPIEATEKQLETVGKNLKKNNVSLDVVSFGEIEDNRAKLEKLIQACNSNDTSHLVEVELPKILSDAILSSSICFGEGGGPGAAAPGGDNFELGVDPNNDPELALALRISMEEARRREEGTAEGGEGAAAAAEGGDASAAGGSAAAPASGTAAAPAAAGAPPAGGHPDIPGFEDMDEDLRAAILLSMQESAPPAAPEPPAAGAAPAAAATPSAPSKMEGEPAEKKQKTDPSASASAPPAAGAADEANLFQDPDFMASLLSELPGVDINDERIQAAIKGDEQKDGDGKDKGGDKKDDKDKK